MSSQVSAYSRGTSPFQGDVGGVVVDNGTLRWITGVRMIRFSEKDVQSNAGVPHLRIVIFFLTPLISPPEANFCKCRTLLL